MISWPSSVEQGSCDRERRVGKQYIGDGESPCREGGMGGQVKNQTGPGRNVDGRDRTSEVSRRT